MRNFGDAVECRFVDVDGPELSNYPHIAERLRRGRLSLPVVAIAGKVRYSGLFSPTFIQRDVREILGRGAEKPKGAAHRTPARGPKPTRPEPWSSSAVSGRSHFGTSVHRGPR